jgi:hypothetical protein
MGDMFTMLSTTDTIGLEALLLINGITTVYALRFLPRKSGTNVINYKTNFSSHSLHICIFHRKKAHY